MLKSLLFVLMCVMISHATGLVDYTFMAVQCYVAAIHFSSAGYCVLWLMYFHTICCLEKPIRIATNVCSFCTELRHELCYVISGCATWQHDYSSLLFCWHGWLSPSQIIRNGGVPTFICQELRSAIQSVQMLPIVRMDFPVCLQQENVLYTTVNRALGYQ